MLNIDENSYLLIRALVYAIDAQLGAYHGNEGIELDNAIILSGMLIDEIRKVDAKRE
ncbi:MAG: hypothetical protein II897_04065 [Clostridia bacterium]|nr:hypothetical protein [Clostridia bacterium]